MTSLIAIVAFLLPGFILIWVVRRGRPYRRASTDLELVLGTLSGALVVHLLLLPWTARLWRTIDPPKTWVDHVAELVAYGFTLMAAGLALGIVCRWAYTRLSPDALRNGRGWQRWRVTRTLARALGLLVDHDPPRAWDQLVSDVVASGGWVLVKPRGLPPFVGLFGKRSRASWSPNDSGDMLLEEIWWTNELWEPLAPQVPRRSAWFSLDSVDYIHVLWPGDESEETQ